MVVQRGPLAPALGAGRRAATGAATGWCTSHFDGGCRRRSFGRPEPDRNRRLDALAAVGRHRRGPPAATRAHPPRRSPLVAAPGDGARRVRRRADRRAAGALWPVVGVFVRCF